MLASPSHEPSSPRTGVYKLMRGIDRPIDTNGNQYVHESAIARWDADASYCPRNLSAWFKQHGNVRGDRRC